MRQAGTIIIATFIAAAGHAQLESPAANRAVSHTRSAASLVTTAIEQLSSEKERLDRDVKLLQHLYSADAALLDASQPATAIQKASEHVAEAERLNSAEFTVRDGLIRVRKRIDLAQRSPGLADFDQLRTSLRQDALSPTSRVVARNTFRLQQEALGWIKFQEHLTAHLRTLTELTDANLRTMHP